MGFFDKMKSAMKSVTGGQAKVTMEFQPTMMFPGDSVGVKITVTSTGGEVKSKGIFVDLVGRETVDIRKGQVSGVEQNIDADKEILSRTFPIAGEFVLGAGETKLFEGVFQLPNELQPTYNGTYAKHQCLLRGRMEAFGNDPDTGYLPVRVGLKA